VVNLAGEGIADKRWSPTRKQLLRDSRVLSTSLVSRAISELPDPPRALINISGVSYYGNRGDEAVYEDSPPGAGFLAELCQEWEAATAPAAKVGIRVVLPRLGPVLTPEGGVLQRLLPVFRMGAGGVIGSGAQHFPWISMPDVVSLFRFLIGAHELRGPVNAVAPESTTNAQFTAALAQAVRRPALLPVPGFALKLAFGEIAQELLSGANVRPRALERAGFRFEYPRLEDALEALLG
jgi:uncharacterized protein